MAAKDTAASLGNYSSTNIQEPGVEEADLVKTDGTWIYLLGEDGTLTIVKADPKEPVLESVLTLEGGPELQVHECYLDGDRFKRHHQYAVCLLIGGRGGIPDGIRHADHAVHL